MMSKFYVTLCCVLWVAACAKSPDLNQIKEDLLQTDREFSQMSEERGVTDAFSAYMAENATVLPQKGHPIIGREKFHELNVKIQEAGIKRNLSWDPYFAEVSESGGLGYTLGTYVQIIKTADGEEQTKTGYYVSIWKKQSDGSWKFVFDTGNDSPLPNQKTENAK